MEITQTVICHKCKQQWIVSGVAPRGRSSPCCGDWWDIVSEVTIYEYPQAQIWTASQWKY